jgi:hypothetical protein
MKKILYLIVLAGTLIPQSIKPSSCACATTSHTFFSVRPEYQAASPERVSLYHNADESSAIQIALFGGRSTRTKSLARYFTPFCKEVLVAKAGTDQNGVLQGDLDVQNFNIITNTGTFQSSFSISPRQSTLGIGFTYHQNLADIMNGYLGDIPWWFEFSTPITRVQNTITINEVIEDNGGGVMNIPGLPAPQQAVGSMTQAFAQSSWSYGKIISGAKMTKWRLADIELKVGGSWCNQGWSMDPYLGVVIPTGNRPTAEFVFEPIVGNNRHVGIMAGLPVAALLYTCDDIKITGYLELNFKYLFSARERRSFDLKYKPWSRYLEIYANFAQAQQAAALATSNPAAGTFLSSPGINLLTQDVRVKPRFSTTINMALTGEISCWQTEIGYNFFMRQAECVGLAYEFPEVAAIKADVGDGFVNPQRTITQPLDVNNLSLSTANFQRAIIRASDLDLNSAAHPYMLAHTVYGALGYQILDNDCYAAAVNLGSSYEFGEDNQTLNRWVVWGKCEIAF